MNERYKEPDGMKQLVERYRKMFQIPENLNYYSKENYKSAEKKFIKFALSDGNLKYRKVPY